SGCQAWTELGAPALGLGAPNGIRDKDGALLRWLREKNAAAVVLRPDGFIYAAAESGQPLPAPPAGLTGNALSTAGAATTRSTDRPADRSWPTCCPTRSW